MLTEEDVARSTVRICSMFRCSEEEKAAYAIAVYEQVNFMDATQFEAVAKKVASEMSAGRRPQGKSYVATFYNMFPRKYDNSMVCGRCDGSGVVMCRVSVTTGVFVDEFDATKPCPSCHTDPAPMKAGWTEIEPLTLSNREHWRRLTNGGKHAVLRAVEAFKGYGRPEWAEKYLASIPLEEIEPEELAHAEQSATLSSSGEVGEASPPQLPRPKPVQAEKDPF